MCNYCESEDTMMNVKVDIPRTSKTGFNKTNEYKLKIVRNKMQIIAFIDHTYSYSKHVYDSIEINYCPVCGNELKKTL